MIIKIEKLIYGGSGVGFVDGMPIFVPLTAPGDEVECEIEKQHKGYALARLLKVLKASPNRIVPKCEYFGRCGGCQWQHIDYAAQILWKQLIVEEQLIRIGKIKDPNVLPTIPSPKIWSYRQRIKLHKDKKGRLGFYAPGSHELVEVDHCLLAELTSGVNTPEYFTQVNPSQNENLRSEVVSLVKKSGTKNILELYCGNGNLTIPISKVVDRITAADSSKKAIKFAVDEVDWLHLKHVHFICQSVKEVVDYSVKEHEKFDCIVLDPPREGCVGILDGLIHLKTTFIIYVSCNPSTLARDIKTLIASGYTLEMTQPIDMFPQTYHIESISLLKLQK